MKLQIKNGRVIDPANGVDQVTDVFVSDGLVAALGTAPTGFKADRVIEATDKLVLPGLVDLAARLREPGFEYRGTLESEMRAALAGGITSLVLPPDTDPTLDEPGLVEMLKHRARQLDQVNLYPLGAMTVGLKGEVITEMAELTEAGCVAFSQADTPILDTNVLLRAMQYARTFDLNTLFDLQRTCGVRLHICRVSSAAGIELVRAAKREGLPVTCDVSANHVHLTDVDIGYYDSNFRLDPPLRGQRDRDAIRAALADGTIDVVCSDHTPVDDDGKMLPFAEAEPGATGLELLLSLTLKWATEAKVPLPEALARVTSGPGRVLAGASAQAALSGQLGVGAPADLCVVDPKAYWQVTRESFLSQSQHTPFLGMELPGKVCLTMVRGQVAWEFAG